MKFEDEMIDFVQIPLNTGKIKSYYAKSGRRYNTHKDYEGYEQYTQTQVLRYNKQGKLIKQYVINNHSGIPGVSAWIFRNGTKRNEVITYRIKDAGMFTSTLPLPIQQQISAVKDDMGLGNLLFYSEKSGIGPVIYLGWK